MGTTLEQLWGVRPRSDGAADASLWAPAARSVALEIRGGATTPLSATGQGWFAGQVTAPVSGTRYRFVVDGTPWPDPAARAQPDGTDGWSEIVDPGAFRWTDGAWCGRPWHETVVYELHLGTFSRAGTFLGAIEHLDHLARLGVTVVELMPVNAFPGARGWGYDGVLPYAPHPAYGTPNELKALVDACHARGLSIVLDVVYNHFGPVSNGLDSYAPGFFTEAHHTPWGPAIDFAAPPVREFFLRNAVMWIEEFHFDGLRVDAVQAVFDDGSVHILDELSRRVHAAAGGRTIHLTLENDNNDNRWLGPGGPYEAQWNDDFHHVMRVLLAGRRDGYYRDYADKPLRRLGTAITEGFSYQGEESRHRPGLVRGTPSAQLPPSAFVNFLQNHDQIGNTPFGQRLSAVAPLGAVRLGAALTILAPSPPMLFMGEEWGSARPFDYFCDYPDPLASAVRKGRRDEFSHLPEFADPASVDRLADPNATATRDNSVLDWDALDQPAHAALLALHTELLALRRDQVAPLLPEIDGHSAAFTVLNELPDGTGALDARWRTRDGHTLVLAANLSGTPAPWTDRPGKVLFRLLPGDPGDVLPAWDLVLGLA